MNPDAAPSAGSGAARAAANPDSERAARELGPWFHNLTLPDGTQTAPDHPLGADFPGRKWRRLAAHLPEDMSGWTALDVGCNAGYYTFELARRGARVTAVDTDPRYLEQARWAAARFDVEDRVDFRRAQVYDVARWDDAYDLVLFMGVFYHLRYPTLALDLLALRTRRLMVFQTLTKPGDAVAGTPYDLGIDDRTAMLEPGWPAMAFIEHRLAGDPTNWWAPNHACALAMLRASGLRVTARPGHEIYVCEPDPERPSDVATWNAAELLAATGRAAAGEPGRPS